MGIQNEGPCGPDGKGGVSKLSGSCRAELLSWVGALIGAVVLGGQVFVTANAGIDVAPIAEKGLSAMLLTAAGFAIIPTIVLALLRGWAGLSGAQVIILPFAVSFATLFGVAWFEHHTTGPGYAREQVSQSRAAASTESQPARQPAREDLAWEFFALIEGVPYIGLVALGDVLVTTPTWDCRESGRCTTQFFWQESRFLVSATMNRGQIEGLLAMTTSESAFEDLKEALAPRWRPISRIPLDRRISSVDGFQVLDDERWTFSRGHSAIFGRTARTDSTGWIYLVRIER